jgi:hypothetical protein
MVQIRTIGVLDFKLLMIGRMNLVTVEVSGVLRGPRLVLEGHRQPP